MNILAFITIVALVYTILLPCISFKRKAHYRAMPKAIFILGLSFSPAIFTFLMTGEFDVLEMKDLYIYTASFLAPVIYWFYDDLELRQEGQREDRVLGAWFLLTYTLFILIVTLFCFSATKISIGSKDTVAKTPWIAEQLPLLPLALLLATLVLWYFTIVSEKAESGYTKKKDQEEKEFVKKVTSNRK